MLCANCDAIPERRDLFCANCGKRLVESVPEPLPADPIEDVDDTVVIPRRGKKAPWFLVLESGRHIEVKTRALVGRGATLDSRWFNAVLVNVTDPTRTVSKTHALVEVDGDRLWFTDLDSTNGMSIARDGGEPVQLVSGVRESASTGDLVHLGQFVVLVERKPRLDGTQRR